LEHFAEGSALTADQGDVIDSDAVEGKYDPVVFAVLLKYSVY